MLSNEFEDHVRQCTTRGADRPLHRVFARATGRYPATTSYTRGALTTTDTPIDHDLASTLRRPRIRDQMHERDPAHLVPLRRRSARPAIVGAGTGDTR